MSAGWAPWLQRAWSVLGTGIANDRLGHALLIVGPEGLGKTALARALSQRLLCTQPPEADGRACGRCRACRLFEAGTHPDLHGVEREANEKTGKLKAEIGVEQIRRLSHWLVLTAQFGGRQVATIQPADTMGRAAANALLKSLEEPMPGRYLILVSARPARLPATIRSRCQRIELRLPPAPEGQAYLTAHGADPAQAASALAAADGNPGLALQELDPGRGALRAQVRSDLAALASGREQPVAIASRWADEHADARLLLAAETARQLARSAWVPASKAAVDLTGLTRPGDFLKLAEWFDEANRTRELLDAPLRSDQLLLGLLRNWRPALQS